MEKQMVRRCGYATSDKALRATVERLREGQRYREDGRFQGTFQVAVRYYFAPLAANQSLSFHQVEAQHAELNRCYQASLVKEIPNNSVYDCASRFADAQIQFFPWGKAPGEALAEADVVRLPLVPSTVNLGQANTLASWIQAQGYDLGHGALHVVFTEPSLPRSHYSQSVKILGFAVPGSNLAVINFKTVGSPSVPNLTDLPEFQEANQGHTLVHEAGHCLMLQHPFPDVEIPLRQPCTGPGSEEIQRTHSTVPDLPLQKRSNLGLKAADLTLAVQGGVAKDNRGKDASRVAVGLSVPYYGCLTQTQHFLGHTLECPWHYMDYGSDPTMKGFLQSQVDTMRAHLVKHGSVYGATLGGQTLGRLALRNLQDPAHDHPWIWAIVVGVLFLGGMLWVLWKVRQARRQPEKPTREEQRAQRDSV